MSETLFKLIVIKKKKKNMGKLNHLGFKLLFNG